MEIEELTPAEVDYLIKLIKEHSRLLERPGTLESNLLKKLSKVRAFHLGLTFVT